MAWKCFVIRQTKECKLGLRRYSSENGCSNNKGYYHNVISALPNTEVQINQMGYLELSDELYAKYPKDYPDWPTKCPCGYSFKEEDAKQLFSDQIYKSDTNEEFTLANAPIGAIWDAYWLSRSSRHKNHPDGMSLVVMTPGGEWWIDGPSNNGNGWEREGEIPNITVSPSIDCAGRYHGWLKNGILSDDIEGRKFNH